MTIKPLQDRVLVEISEAQKKTSGGLYIPDTAQEKAQTGTVIAIGDSSDISVKVNDKVMFEKYAGTPLSLDGKDCLIIKIKDIMAIVEA